MDPRLSVGAPRGRTLSSPAIEVEAATRSPFVQTLPPQAPELAEVSEPLRAPPLLIGLPGAPYDDPGEAILTGGFLRTRVAPLVGRVVRPADHQVGRDRGRGRDRASWWSWRSRPGGARPRRRPRRSSRRRRPRQHPRRRPRTKVVTAAAAARAVSRPAQARAASRRLWRRHPPRRRSPRRPARGRPAARGAASAVRPRPCRRRQRRAPLGARQPRFGRRPAGRRPAGRRRSR